MALKFEAPRPSVLEHLHEEEAAAHAAVSSPTLSRVIDRNARWRMRWRTKRRFGSKGARFA